MSDPTHRVATALVYAAGQGGRRVSSAIVYAVEPQFTPPEQPAVELEVLSTTEIEATIIPGDEADDHELYVQQGSAAGLFEAGNLHADDLGSDPIPVSITDLDPGEWYWVGVRAINDIGHTDSEPVSARTWEDLTGFLLVLSAIDELDPREHVALSGDQATHNDLLLSGEG